MRGVLVVLLISVVAALPMAVALGSTTVAVPDEQVTVPGVHQDVDSSQYAPEGPSASGSLQTKDATIHVSGPGCTVDPTHKIASGQVTSCRGGSVRGADAVDPDLVEAKIGLSLGGAAPAPAARHATPLAIAGAAVASVVANPTVLLAAAAASVSVVGLYALWRALKWTGLFALLPLYSHISDGEILDDENRANIYRLIQAEPGISTKDVATRLGLAWGTVTHHLGKLEKRRFVVSKKYGKYRRYFANGQGGLETKDQVAVLRLDRTGDVAALIRSTPGMTQKAVSQALGVSSSTILWHVKRLEGANLITKVREGKLVRYYPGASLNSTLAHPVAPPVNAA